MFPEITARLSLWRAAWRAPACAARPYARARREGKRQFASPHVQGLAPYLSRRSNRGRQRDLAELAKPGREPDLQLRRRVRQQRGLRLRDGPPHGAHAGAGCRFVHRLQDAVCMILVGACEQRRDAQVVVGRSVAHTQPRPLMCSRRFSAKAYPTSMRMNIPPQPQCPSDTTPQSPLGKARCPAGWCACRLGPAPDAPCGRRTAPDVAEPRPTSPHRP